MSYRSAVTGRYISRSAAARWPNRSVRESSGSGIRRGTSINRSANTGRFVSSATSKRWPQHTLTEKV